jgi:hypothetical protein
MPEHALPNPFWIDFSALYQKADALAQAYNSNNLVFFLGAGASKAYTPYMPGWQQLLTALQAELPPATPQGREEVTRLIEDHKVLLAAEAIRRYAVTDLRDRHAAVDQAVARILQQRLARSPDRSPVLHLTLLDFAVPIFTTNYDTILEDLIATRGIETYRRTPVTYEDENDAALLLNPAREPENVVFKLHGSVGRQQRLILDESDYFALYFQQQWPVSLELLRHTLATKMVVFVGFSLSDPEIMPILRQATRYSSSYQHMALMPEADVTPTEVEMLRTNYRVDPVLYKEHSDLPLLIMEMRAFSRQEGIPLRIQPALPKLEEALAAVKEEKALDPDCVSIVFGSFAKYGAFVGQHGDVDILFLVEGDPVEPRVKCESADEILESRADVTVMAFDEFERLLKVGDPFATSVLATGCPIEDPGMRYGILSRGFRVQYEYDVVLRNVLEQYRLRWLRLCLYADTELPEYLQICYQWAVTLMQTYILADFYPIAHLASISLLGNPRYVIHQFARRFSPVDESFYVSLLHAVKRPAEAPPLVRPAIDDMVAAFLNAVRPKLDEDALQLLLPGRLLLEGDAAEICDLYEDVAALAERMLGEEERFGFGYEETHAEDGFQVALQREDVSPLDYIFFIGLHKRVVAAQGSGSVDGERLLAICQDALAQWREAQGAGFLAVR